MRISDWSSDLCSSDLERSGEDPPRGRRAARRLPVRWRRFQQRGQHDGAAFDEPREYLLDRLRRAGVRRGSLRRNGCGAPAHPSPHPQVAAESFALIESMSTFYDEPFADSSAMPTYQVCRSEARPSELQSLMRNPYAVYCLKNQNKNN